jgi:hypothetical protein
MAPRSSKLAADFCRCIKKVRKTIKLRRGVKKTSAAKEAAAIGVCVNSVLQTKGKTLKKFGCGKKATLKTQKPLKGGALGEAAPYASTDPTASRIEPGDGIRSYYENAVKAPVRL